MIDRAARLACVALVVAVVVGGAGVTGAPVSAQTTDTIADTQIDPDVVSLTVDLRADGSAAWTIEYRVRLDDDNTTQAFLSLRDDIEANESQYTSDFRGRIESTVSAAENTTGREMAVENVSVAASRQQLPQDYGVVSYTFVWTNFATVEDGTIRAGDALAGFFLDSESSLQFAWPEGYGLETVQPQPDDTREDSRVVVWNGPVDFSQDEPTLVVSEQAAGGTPTTAPGGDDSGDGGDEGDGLPMSAIVALVLAAGVVGWFLYRRRDEAGAPTVGTPEAGDAGATGGSDAGSAAGGAGATGGSDAGSGAGGGPADASESGGEAAGAADGVGAGAASGAAAAPGDEGAESDASDGADDRESAGDAESADAGSAVGEETPDDDQAPWEDELLSNQEQVLALVEHEGGRMKQQEVAQRLEWTDAKTSQVVRKMREAGDLDAFRLGRENVLVLPDEEFGPGDPNEE